MTLERNVLLAFLAAAALLPALVTDQYLLHLGVVALFYAILATSLNLVVGYVGEFSLGHTAFLGAGAYTAALLSTHLGLPMWATIPLAGLISAVFGFGIGAITLRLQGPYFVIVTLSFAEVLRIVANNWIAVTNGPMGLAGIDQFGITNKGTFFYIVLGLTAVALYLAFRFVHSNAGRAAVAVRENRYVAQSIGVDPFGTAMQAFVLGAFLAGLAGGFYAHYISFVGPEVFRFPFMVTMIIMVLLGGKGTLLGPIAGAVIVTLLEEYLREMQELRLTLFGLIVMAVVLFLPNGLMGFIAQRREQQGTKPAPRAATKERTV
ncbi:branched-chain amino acid ABC transporter permease [Azospirillum canadense]|uniref:branched-chain amino acid ABC transporter permease n=1 Tax=Azospirillum canadense TaxID=403962 RepID=UPI002227B725|nr:branched-chain amino acid ABC transporter permease [Azospirillum canadense]MCW2240096.1 branched-chain amino acid transport system permease protein [Azospirillum canadense]